MRSHTSYWLRRGIVVSPSLPDLGDYFCSVQFIPRPRPSLCLAHAPALPDTESAFAVVGAGPALVPNLRQRSLDHDR